MNNHSSKTEESLVKKYKQYNKDSKDNELLKILEAIDQMPCTSKKVSGGGKNKLVSFGDKFIYRLKQLACKSRSKSQSNADNTENNLPNIPIDIIFKILENLSVQEKAAVFSTCQYLNNAAKVRARELHVNAKNLNKLTAQMTMSLIIENILQLKNSEFNIYFYSDVSPDIRTVYKIFNYSSYNILTKRIQVLSMYKPNNEIPEFTPSSLYLNLNNLRNSDINKITSKHFDEYDMEALKEKRFSIVYDTLDNSPADIVSSWVSTYEAYRDRIERKIKHKETKLKIMIETIVEDIAKNNLNSPFAYQVVQLRELNKTISKNASQSYTTVQETKQSESYDEKDPDDPFFKCYTLPENKIKEILKNANKNIDVKITKTSRLQDFEVELHYTNLSGLMLYHILYYINADDVERKPDYIAYYNETNDTTKRYILIDMPQKKYMSKLSEIEIPKLIFSQSDTKQGGGKIVLYKKRKYPVYIEKRKKYILVNKTKRFLQDIKVTVDSKQ